MSMFLGNGRKRAVTACRIYASKRYICKKASKSMSELKKRIGALIKEARNAKNLTQKELGEILGISHSTVNGYETGKQNLTIDTLEKVANALGVEPGSFFN